MTERIMDALTEAKKGNKDAAREFALLCNAKDKETIKKIMDIVLPINSIPCNLPKGDFSKGFQKGESYVMGTTVK